MLPNLYLYVSCAILEEDLSHFTDRGALIRYRPNRPHRPRKSEGKTVLSLLGGPRSSILLESDSLSREARGRQYLLSNN